MSLSESTMLQLHTLRRMDGICKHYNFFPKNNSRLKKINTRPIILIWITMIFCFWMTGCKMEKENWVDQMLSEMLTAKIKAQRTPGSIVIREPTKISVAAQKYFRPGMPKEEAFLLLQELKDYGFYTSENRHEGARRWPDGEFKTYESGRYADEKSVRANKVRYPKGVSRFSARMEQYGTVYLVFPKGAALSFSVVDGEDVISDVRANVWVKSL